MPVISRKIEMDSELVAAVAFPTAPVEQDMDKLEKELNHFEKKLDDFLKSAARFKKYL